MEKTKVNSHDEITFDILADAVDETLRLKHTSFAPLGSSSRSVVVCGINGDERREGVSFRLHSRGIEMLVCDYEGAFLFYGKFHTFIEPSTIKAEFMRILEAVKPFMSKPF